MLTKAMVMEHFDELVTDPAVTLAEVEAHLGRPCGQRAVRSRYWVAATLGTTGQRGIFLWDLDSGSPCWPPTIDPLTGPGPPPA